LAPRNSEESENLLRRCIALTADSVDRFHIILGDLYFENQRYADASQEYLRSAELRKSHVADPHIPPDLLFARLAKALYYSGRYGEALGFAVQASSWNPDSEEVNELIYKIVMKQSSISRNKTSIQ
jgi:tetratricopeptide (TPR) repeat protein